MIKNLYQEGRLGAILCNAIAPPCSDDCFSGMRHGDKLRIFYATAHPRQELYLMEDALGRLHNIKVAHQKLFTQWKIGVDLLVFLKVLWRYCSCLQLYLSNVVESVSYCFLQVSERDMRMTFLPQFKACVQAGSYNVMCSYNRWVADSNL